MGYPVVLPSLTLYRHDYRAIPFRFWADADKSVPIDLTAFGPLVQAQARASEDGPLLCQLEVDASQAGQGALVLILDAAAWNALADARSFGYDVQFSQSDGSRALTVLRQHVTVQRDYTHA